jgi:hypothetical protein
LPADDAPHDRLTEWWYYTGHLRDGSGHRYGFEFVTFRAERGVFPVSWAAHLAITDEAGNAFHYAQRSEIGRQVDRSATRPSGQPGFDLRIDRQVDGIQGPMASGPPSTSAAWTMQGGNGHDRLTATTTPDEATEAGSPGGFGLDLTLLADKPAALHDGDGWIDFGPAGGSYYYSRTSLAASGPRTSGRRLTVTGTASSITSGALHLGQRRGLGLVAVNPAMAPTSRCRRPRPTARTRWSTGRSWTRRPGRHLDQSAFSVVTTDAGGRPARDRLPIGLGRGAAQRSGSSSSRPF